MHRYTVHIPVTIIYLSNTIMYFTNGLASWIMTVKLLFIMMHYCAGRETDLTIILT